MKNNYTADHIKVLSDLQHMRLRKSMYIGEGKDPRALITEIIDNAIDEVQAGYSEWFEVHVNTKENCYSVRDYGRGIPHGKKKLENGEEKEIVEVLLSKASGKLYYNGQFWDNNIDVASLEVAVNTQFALNDVVLSDGTKANFTNVKLFDGVYGQSNKAEFVALLSNYSGTLTGYYVLAENITFSPSVDDKATDRFVVASGRIFNATFDGRGYTLNNLSMEKGYGIFTTSTQ